MRTRQAILIIAIMATGCSTVQHANKPETGTEPMSGRLRDEITITVALHNQSPRRLAVCRQNATLRQVLSRYRDELGVIGNLEAEILGDQKRIEALIDRELSPEESTNFSRFRSFGDIDPHGQVFILSAGESRLFIHEELVLGTSLGSVKLQDGAEIVSIPHALVHAAGLLGSDRSQLEPGKSNFANLAAIWPETRVQPEAPTVTFNFPGMGGSKVIQWGDPVNQSLVSILRELYSPDTQKFSGDFPPTVLVVARKSGSTKDILFLPLGAEFCSSFFSNTSSVNKLNETMNVRLPYLKESPSEYFLSVLDGDVISVLRPEDIPL